MLVAEEWPWGCEFTVAYWSDSWLFVVFRGLLNLTLEKLLCSVPLLSEIAYVILHRYCLDAQHSASKSKLAFWHFYTIKGISISVSGITVVVELTSIHLKH